MIAEHFKRTSSNLRFLLLLRLILAGIFLAAGAGKVQHIDELTNNISGYGLLPPALAIFIACCLPWLEIILGFGLLLGRFQRFMSSLAALLVCGFIFVNVYSLTTESITDNLCGCFGDIMPMSHGQSLFTDFIMLGMSLLITFNGAKAGNRSFHTPRTMVPRTAIMILLSALMMISTFPVETMASNDSLAEAHTNGISESHSIQPETPATGYLPKESIKPTLMYFYNDQCPNCLLQSPVISALEEEYGDAVTIERYESSEYMELIRTYGITSVPTILIYDGDPGTGTGRILEGYTPLETIVESLGDPFPVADVSSPVEDSMHPLSNIEAVNPLLSVVEELSSARMSDPESSQTEMNVFAPTGQSLLWPSGASVATFGANAGITIDMGTILSTGGCAADGGVDDWIYPYADIYIVPSGSVSIGSALVDAGGSKNTVWGASGGIFINQTIGYTSPGGSVGPGTYAIVYDECQNGKLDSIDALFDPAFVVTIPADVPPMPASFAAVKIAARKQAEYHFFLKGRMDVIFKNLRACEQALSIPGCIANPAKCLLEFTLNKIKSAISSSLGISMNAEAETLNFVGNMALHYLGIAADPPDAEYRNLTPLSPVKSVDPQSNDPVYLASAEFTNSLMAEDTLAEAFLTSVERYQGAEAVSDGEWALIHARNIRDYASDLAVQLAVTNETIVSFNAAFAADIRPFDDMVPTLIDFQTRMETTGFSDNETLYLINLGLSETEIADIAAEIADLEFDGVSKAMLGTYFSELIDANTEAIATLETLSLSMDDLITTLATDPYAFQLRPLADAGGPYIGDEGAMIVLDGIGSADPDGTIVAWSWDLDLDGEFDDASGPSPAVSFDHASRTMIGLMVTDDTGKTGIDYTFITINNVNSPPLIETYAPVSPAREAVIGDTIDFSVTASDPDGDTVSVEWWLDGVQAGSGTSFSYQPVNESQVGMHVLQVKVSDDSPLGGTVSRSWGISVLAEDADIDGWRANIDCDDSDSDVNPGMTEIPGNGIDDDCNILTSDTPPVPLFSFTPAAPMVGDALYFTDESVDTGAAIVSWLWEFGDGVTDNVQNPVHSYSAGGSFTVTLTITDETGGTERTAQIITVLSPPVTAFTTGKAMNVALLGDGAEVIGYSSVYNTNVYYQPENAIDGNPSSSWYTGSGQTTDQWLTIALTGTVAHQIDKIVLGSTGGTNCIKDFEVRVSVTGTDDADFTTVLSGTVPQVSGFHEFAVPQVSARYVQLHVIDNWGYPTNTTVPHLGLITLEREGGIVSLLEGLPPLIVGYSSQSSDSFSPEKLLDDSSSYWQTAAGQITDQWVKVELGGGTSHIIERVVLAAVYVDYGLRDFEIRVSNTTSDDAAFTTVFSGRALNNTIEQEFAFAPVEARYVQLFVLNNYGSNYLRVATLKVLTPDRSNVAQISGVGAFVISYSSEYSAAYTAKSAIDFKQNNYWRTATGQATNQWIKVRLMPGAPHLVDRVKIRASGGTSSPKNFEIRVSNSTIDNTAFVPVYNGTLPQDGLEHWFVFPSVEANYIQLYLYDNYGANYMLVYDFQVYSPQLGSARVPFVDLSDDESGIVAWNWAFGDGGTSAAQHPLHVYSAPGTYTVSLTTIDSYGLSDLSSMEYTVLSPPRAEFTWAPDTPDEGQNTNLKDASTDSDGIVLGWLWQFSHITSQPTSSTTSTNFPDNDDYDITLTVTDSQLLTAATTHTITTLNVAPNVDAGRNLTLFWGQNWVATLPDYSPLNSSVSDAGTADRDSLIVDWDFGDGETVRIENATTVSMRVPHSFGIPGVYTATAVVTDKDGDFSTDTMTATVIRRDTVQKVYATLETDENSGVKVVSKLWDTHNVKQIIEGRIISFTLGSSSITAVTDANGYAEAYIPGNEGDTVTASFAGDTYYTASEANGTVKAAAELPVGDIVFIIDESGSMGPDIEDVKANVANIASQIDGIVDYQLGLVGFGAGSASHWETIFPGTPQQLPDGLPHIHLPLTDRISEFEAELYDLIASGGVEPGFSAVTLATSSAMGYFREECPSCIILITDENAETNITDTAPETREDAIAALIERNAIFLGIVEPMYSDDDYGPNPGSLAEATGGEVFDIMEFRSDPEPVLVAILEKCVARILEESSANLSITKSAAPEPVIVGEELTYTIEVTNHGPADGLDVVVTDTLSENVTLVSAIATQGACLEVSGNVECELGTILTGAAVEIIITVIPDEEGTVTNVATVTGSRFDPDTSNNFAVTVSTVSQENQPPELDPIGDRMIEEDELLEIVINATDPDEDPLEYSATNLPDGAEFDPVSRVFSWKPGFDDAGIYPDIMFKVADKDLSDSENITITVLNVNRAPVAEDDLYFIDEGETLAIDPPGILENDYDDDDDELTAVLVTPSQNGTLSLFADGSFTYIPDPGFSGTDNFTYTADDGDDVSEIATVLITIDHVNRPPVADAGGPYLVDEGKSVTLDASGSYDPDSGFGDSIVSREWDLDDDGQYDDASGITAQFYSAEHGLYTVAVRVTDSFGKSAEATASVQVLDLGPSAAFTWNPEPQAEGAAISFTDASTSAPDTIVAWEWDFGGLATSSDPEPSFTFMDDGTYTVTLTVTDEDGSSDTVNRFVTITDLGPSATLSGINYLDEGQQGNYDSSGSLSYPDPIVLFEWDWDFDEITFLPSGDTGSSQTHSWDAPGTYMVGVRVTDDDGSSDIATLLVTVNSVNSPPVADPGGPYAIDEGNELDLDGSGSYDPDGSIASWEWDFGDGQTGTGETPAHTWMDNGSYLATLTVTDNEGATGSASVEVIVNDLGPSAGFTWNPEPQAEGAAISFTDASTSAPDTIVAWEWDFGGLATSSDPGSSFTFMDDSTYTVTLTVTDEDGSTDTVNHSVTITDLGPVADLFGDSALGITTSGNYNASGSSSFPDEIVAFEWDWDYNGVTFVPSGDSGALQIHSWSHGGEYVVAVRVIDDDGSSDIATLLVTVNSANSPPVADPGILYTIDEGVELVLDGSGSYDPDGSIASWEWDFGDGQTGTGETPAHTWVDNGSYLATLIVTDNEGATGSASVEVIVNDLGPTAVLHGDIVLAAGQTGEYCAGDSVTFPDAIVGFEWDWDYDGITFVPSGNTGALQIHSWPLDGVYVVAVRVIDDDGSSDIATLLVTVNSGNSPPVADPGSPYTIDEGVELVLDGSGSYDPDGSIASWEWDFGDRQTGTGETPSHTWMDNGSYLATLIVTDNEGATDSASVKITVNDLVPTAVLHGDIVLAAGQTGEYCAGDSMTFPDAIVGFEWDWDYNGITFVPSGNTGALQIHSWPLDGVYVVAVRVIDDDGSSDIATLLVTVNSAAVFPDSLFY